MKVDCYQSNDQPSYGLVVPSGTNPDSLTGDAGAAITKLKPLVLRKQSVDLASVAVGDLYKHLERQITECGAGLMRTEVQFTEIVQ